MDLYIVRHAWAADRDDPRWPDDELRPLTEQGTERFARMAAMLVDRGMKPEIIAASPLVRCVETAQILSVAAGKVELIELDALQPGGDAGELFRWVVRQARKHAQIALVGHTPDVDRLTAALIGDGQALIRFSKGAVAALRFDDVPALGSGELRWLATAKLLGC